MEKQITVLIADNSKPMREILGLIISGMENTELVGVAMNGEEAIELAKEKLPDIILMDINMSPVNGFEATRKILKHNPAAKIIGLSLHNKVSYAKNLMQLGARGYVTKSSSFQKIIDAIKTVAAGGKYIDNELSDLL